MPRTNERPTYIDGGYVDLDQEVLIDPGTGQRIREPDSERLAAEAGKNGPGRPSLGRSGKSPIVTYRVAESTKKRLADYSKRSHRRLSDVAREALEDYLARHDT